MLAAASRARCGRATLLGESLSASLCPIRSSAFRDIGSHGVGGAPCDVMGWGGFAGALPAQLMPLPAAATTGPGRSLATDTPDHPGGLALGNDRILKPTHEPGGALGDQVALLIQCDHVIAVIEDQGVHQP